MVNLQVKNLAYEDWPDNMLCKAVAWTMLGS